jgi:hypothetical protein
VEPASLSCHVWPVCYVTLRGGFGACEARLGDAAAVRSSSRAHSVSRGASVEAEAEVAVAVAVAVVEAAAAAAATVAAVAADTCALPE